MKVLFADKLHPSAARRLRTRGADVAQRPELSADDLPAAMAEEAPDILVVRSTKVSKAAIDASERLKLIIRAGAGYDNIDATAASNAGVFIANCPGKNSIAVAELTWGLILAADRRIAEQDRDLKLGKWNKSEFSKARGLYGRCLGVIGMGNIGCEVAARGRAFGMKVVAWSLDFTAEQAAQLGVQHASSPIEVARMADVLTVHVAGNSSTERLISGEVIEAMRPKAILVNTSRGSVVDETALLAGIEEKGIRAALDVYRGEPGSGSGEFDSAVARSAAVVGTHHVGASTDQAQEAIADRVVDIASEYMRNGTAIDCINLATRGTSDVVLTVRHKNRPGVLAKVFDVLSRAQINVEWMDNILYDGAEAACARIQLGQTPSSEDVSRIRQSTGDILSVDLASPPM